MTACALRCNTARETAVGFYLKMGYEVEGDRFAELKIPHFHMRKRLIDN